MIVALAVYTALKSAAQTPIQPPAQTPAQPAPVQETPPASQGPTPPIQPRLTPVPLPQAVTPPTVPSTEVTKPLTAAEAAQIALRLQPQLDLARADILAAQGRAQAARSGLVPNVSVGSSFTRTIDINTGETAGGAGGSGGGSRSTFNTFNSALTLNQLLFDFNRTRNLVRQQEALTRAAQHELTGAQNDLVYNVKNAFYTYVQDLRLVHTQEANLANRQGQLALAQARLNTGLGAPADVVQAQVGVGDASQLLSQARQTAITSRVALATAMGIDPRTPIDAADSDEPAPDTSDVTKLVDVAIQNRPEIRQYQETLRANGYALSAAKATNAPNVGLALSLGSVGSDPFASPTAQFGISVNWNFIDGGQTAGLVKQARADILAAQANLKLTTQTVIQDVSNAFTALKTAEQSQQIAQSQVANATESVRLAEGRFRAGITTFLEVTNAQASLVAAQVTAINADAAIQQARAALRRAIAS